MKPWDYNQNESLFYRGCHVLVRKRSNIYISSIQTLSKEAGPWIVIGSLASHRAPSALLLAAR
ncbi:MAG: hypothetical protein LZF60_30018 [Nitrospira sp.]|nr:MAG: hypothetical protein LZF60_30018 [Nitrospira sp.]